MSRGSLQQRWPLYALLCGALLVVLACADAALRVGPATDRAQLHGSLTRILGTSDLALSSSSRWLRHPTQVEPAAAFADAPATLDTDPAGALIVPDPRLLGQSARPLRRVPAAAGQEGRH